MLSELIMKQHFSGFTTNDFNCHIFYTCAAASKGPGESARTMCCLQMQVDPQSYVLTHFVTVCRSKKEGKDQESIQSSTTPDPGNHMGK